MPYIVLKSGMEIFDLAMAYGIGVILHLATEILELEEEVKIENFGSGWKIYGPEKLTKGDWKEIFKKAEWQGIFNEESSFAWQRVFFTKKQKWRDDVKKVEKALEGTIPEIHSAEPIVAEVGSKGETIPGPLEPTGFKGARSKTRSPSAGNIKVDLKSWALACLGGACAIHFAWLADGTSGIIFDPEVLYIDQIEFLQNLFKEECRLKYPSDLVAVIDSSLALIQALIKRKTGENRFYSAYFSTLKHTGQQSKPGGGGKFDLEILNKIWEDNPQVADELFGMWRHLIRQGTPRGNEDLALSLAEFIASFSLSAWDHHSRVLLRYILHKKIKQKNQYQEEQIKEVMRYVH